MRITRVYTRTGDAGQTRLVGGQQVPKSHTRIESYGTVDELNPEKGEITVLVTIFGRQAPVELEYWQISKVDR